MENKLIFIEPLLERAETYGKTSYELFKLKALSSTAEVASTFISRASAILFLTLFTLIMNIGLALWLGDLLGKSYYGFFCVAGFYGIIGAVLYFFMHGYIKRKISTSIVQQMLN